MDPQVKKDLSDSECDFKNIVWPAIKHWFGGGEIIPVENVTESHMAQKLDTKAGIDIWHMTKDGIRGVASRVQWPDNGKRWDTFTIRAERPTGVKTELQKRQNALNDSERGWLYPAITCQAYLSARGGQILSAGAVLTQDLIPIVTELWEKGKNIRVTYSGEKLIYIKWDALIEKYGVNVKVLSKSDEYTYTQRPLF